MKARHWGVLASLIPLGQTALHTQGVMDTAECLHATRGHMCPSQDTCVRRPQHAHALTHARGHVLTCVRRTTLEPGGTVRGGPVRVQTARHPAASGRANSLGGSVWGHGQAEQGGPCAQQGGSQACPEKATTGWVTWEALGNRARPVEGSRHSGQPHRTAGTRPRGQRFKWRPTAAVSSCWKWTKSTLKTSPSWPVILVHCWVSRRLPRAPWLWARRSSQTSAPRLPTSPDSLSWTQAALFRYGAELSEPRPSQLRHVPTMLHQGSCHALGGDYSSVAGRPLREDLKCVQELARHGGDLGCLSSPLLPMSHLAPAVLSLKGSHLFPFQEWCSLRSSPACALGLLSRPRVQVPSHSGDFCSRGVLVMVTGGHGEGHG